MLRNYLIVTFRNMVRHRVYASINIVGLAIGIAACLLIMLYVSHELSFDQVPAADRIYRVENNYIRHGELIYESAATFPAVAPALKDGMPGVATVARFFHAGIEDDAEDNAKVVISYEAASDGPIAFEERNVLFADAAFLDLFDVQMASGDPVMALTAPGSVVLSASAAQRYFGTVDPVGKILRFNDSRLHAHLLTVTGVYEDETRNMHVRYDMLISYPTLYTRRADGAVHYEQHWYDYTIYTYALLKPGTDPSVIGRRLSTLMDAQFPRESRFDAEGNHLRRNDFWLTPLRDIHLYSDHQNEVAVNGNGTVVYFLCVVAGFILLIAWVNYINLTTARAVDRAREVGIRKTVGSTRRQLVQQFLTESLVLNVLALLLAVELAQLTLPYFNALTGLTLSLWQVDQPLWWVGMLTLFITGTVLSGLYPAYVLSSFQPARALKTISHRRAHGVLLRKGLVIFQFAVSIALIVGTVAVYTQLEYMMNRDLGFETDQVLIVEAPGSVGTDAAALIQRIRSFKEELVRTPGVRTVASSSVIPGQGIHRGIVVTRGQESDTEIPPALEEAYVDYDFLDVYGMQMIAGRNFSRTFATDASAVILNTSAVRLLGFNSPEAAVGSYVYQYGSRQKEVVGVIDDYHHETLRRGHDPMYFLLAPDMAFYYSIKLGTTNFEAVVRRIEAVYADSFPGNPFRYYFMDDFFNRQYQPDRQFSTIFRAFAGLAILIACLGLYGLTAYTISRRTREMSLRKVLGAGSRDIVLLISKDFFILVLLAAAIALPLSYGGITQWLASFAFRVDLPWWLFTLPVLAVTILTMGTVGLQALKAGLRNPVENLRVE